MINNPPPTPISAFNDNYIWAIVHPQTQNCWVVDPGDAQAVHQFLQVNQLKLAGILLTHHHQDHQGGVKTLANPPDIPIWMPKDGLCHGNHPVDTGDIIHLAPSEIRLKVMRTRGHTLDHICYFNDTWLFCGDTLFSGGCGRVFEGTYQEMYCSLQLLSKLKPETWVFPAHEYTMANLDFALQVDPNNQALKDYHARCLKLRDTQQPTLPTQIAIEKAINPFLRVETPDIIEACRNYNHQFLHQASDQPEDIFAILRQWKDRL